ncbi:MAG: hypothetical protein ABI768_14330, partial [Acidobacteriota bacterium]
MKATLAAAVLIVAAAAAPAAVNAYMTFVTLPQAVKLGDGSVLPAGKYDVQIEYKGFGNAAELHFFQNKVFKGKTNAEARGFPSTAPGGATDASTVKMQKADKKVFDVKGESADAKMVKMNDAAAQKANQIFPKVEDKWQPAGAPGAFSWANFGFREGHKGIVTPGPPSMLKLS